MAAILFLGGLYFYVCVPGKIDEMAIYVRHRKAVGCLRKIGQPG